MDLTSIYYFTEVIKDKNITRTAERLYMSQQTLSNHMARLENELGAALFLRRPSLTLTPAGEQFLQYALTVTREYSNVKNRISDIEKQDRGSISFGASTLRMSSCLPAVMPIFHEQYPDVEIRLTDSISRHLVPRVIGGELDMAVVAQNEEIPVLQTTELMKDRLYLCVSEALLHKYYPESADSLKRKSIRGASLADFGKLPFCMYSNQLGNTIHGAFEEAGIIPHVFIRSTYTQIGVDLCMQGMAACIATQMNLINRKEIPADINIFPLCIDGKPLIHSLSLIRRKDRYLASYALFFIGLLEEYFRKAEAQTVRRKAEEAPDSRGLPH